MDDALIIRKFKQDKENFKILTTSDISNRIEELGITTIKITDGEIVNYFVQNIKYKILYNDEENPIVLVDNIYEKMLTINPNWYLKNQKKATELINYVAKNNKESEMTIADKAIIDNELIESLCENSNIKTLYLAKYSDNPYSLTKEHYLKIKKSAIESVITAKVDDELEDNFDEMIYYNSRKNVIGESRYSDIKKFCGIRINSSLTDKDLDNFKYLGKQNVLEFTIKTIKEIRKAIQRLRVLGFNNKIVIVIKDKGKFNENIENFDIPEYEQLYIRNEKTYEETLFNMYKSGECILDKLVKGIESLSPFEKYIYVYNITKRYKKYKENEENRCLARNLYNVLENEYMVCVGFSKILVALCDKLNIPCREYSISIDTSYDKKKKKEKQFTTIRSEHDRNIVYLKDEKYGIDGYYVSDATWDNDLDKDLYIHMLMTVDEMNSHIRYNWFSKTNPTELFAAKSIDEFYQILNFVMSRKNSHDLNYYIKTLITYIESLDPDFINILKEKYPYLKEFFWRKNNINDLIDDLSVYVVTKNNNKITGETFESAIKNIYGNVYGYRREEIDEALTKMFNDNYEYALKKFPKRYRKNEKVKNIIMNAENKWQRKTR